MGEKNDEETPLVFPLMFLLVLAAYDLTYSRLSERLQQARLFEKCFFYSRDGERILIDLSHHWAT